MRPTRWHSRKNRRSTRDRFVSVLRGETERQEKQTAWFRRREFFLPLLMIFLFFMVTFVVKSVFLIQNQTGSSSETPAPSPAPANPSGEETTEGEDEEMTYEEAKRIFGSP